MSFRASTIRKLEKHGIWTGLSPDHAVSRRYLFIHIPKNGGMTVRRSEALKPQIVPAGRHTHKSRAHSDAVLRVMNANGEHHGFEHARLRDVSLKVRRMFRPFAIVRNPWSRVVSRYRFAQTTMDSGASTPNYAAHSFEAFLDERHLWGNTEYYWHRAIRGWYPQRDYVVDEVGRIAVDILRLERLDDEIQRYFGLAEQQRRRNRSRSGHHDYRTYYDARTIQIVADWYAADIEAFGFDFDTPERRNCLYGD